MKSDLRVKVLKKTKDDRYPEHIIVEKKSSSEGAHLYFDQGNLAKFVYMKRAQSPVQMEWNAEQKKYMIVPPPYQVKASYNVPRDNRQVDFSFVQRDGAIPTSFCTFKVSNRWKETIITFFESNGDRFAVLLRLDGKCKARYIEGWGADIKITYPHQKRRTCPTPSIIKKERT